MRVTFLGTAAGENFPALWCRCEPCQAARERGGRNVRFRCVVLINDDLLIDSGPDLSAAACRFGIDLASVQALLVTHPHGDHLAYEPFLMRGGQWRVTPLPLLNLYASRASLIKLGYGEGESPLATASRVRYGAGPVPSPASFRIESHRIAPFEHIMIRTGGAPTRDPNLPTGRDTVPAMPVREYELWTLAANHPEPANEPYDEPMLFVVRQISGSEVAGRSSYPTMLYATDTGPFPAATWESLDRLGAAGVRFDVTVLDTAFGTWPAERLTGDKHLTLPQMIAHQEELARRGLLTSETQRFATHFVHGMCPPHEELVALLAPHSIQPAYDDLTLTL